MALGISLSEFLRHGAEFGSGVIQGRQGRQAAQQQQEAAQQRAAMEEALLQSQIENQQSLIRTREAPKAPEPPKPLTERQVRDRLLESMHGQPEDASDQDVMDRFQNLNVDIPGSTAIGAYTDFQEEQAAEARRAATASQAAERAERVGAPDPAGDPAGQRQRIREAVDAIMSVQEDARALGARFEGGEQRERIDLILQLAGFESVEELFDAQRAFGGAEPDTGGADIGSGFDQQAAWDEAAAELTGQGVTDPEQILGPRPG